MSLTAAQRLADNMARCIASGEPFTADDVTDYGRITIDTTHRANGKQSGIGSMFREHSSLGHITRTGETRRSGAPHRKGGLLQVWRGTVAGMMWVSAHEEAAAE